jgi:uncharacterized protein with von Willebrand factor type A (vWA) domain
MLSVAAARSWEAGTLLQARLAGFAGFLHANGFAVAASDAAAVLEAVEHVGILDPRLLRLSLKALLCGRGEEWRRFDELFDAYFLPPNRSAFERRRAANAELANAAEAALGDGDATLAEAAAGRESPGADDGAAARHGASRQESLASADFRDLDRADDVRDIEALMRRFARRLRHLELRREARFQHGRRLDLRRTIRRSVASGGIPFRLAWKDRRRVRPRLVLLLDVSRSMSQYSFFYLRLARALANELADVHCFIFHTRLTGVSEALRDADPWRSQERMHLLAAGWAGGTRIGECLRAFQRDHAARLVHARTGIVIVSDGYDTGEPEVLADALAALGRRARRVVWINPLLGQAGYTPDSRGMRAALPHIDLFAPGADLAGISRILPDLIATLH